MYKFPHSLLVVIALLLTIVFWNCGKEESETVHEDSSKQEVQKVTAEVPLPVDELTVEVVDDQPVEPPKLYDEVSVELAQEKRCLSCHEGIEVISYRMAQMWGADTKCEVCHMGNPTANTKKEAHKGMIAHPGDLSVQSLTCGQCHDDGGVIRKDIEGLIPGVVRTSRVVSNGERNHSARVLRNSMAT